MKKVSTSQLLLGAGIVALIYILYKNKQKNETTEMPIDDVDVVDTKDDGTKGDGTKGDTDEKLDTSGVPAQCLKGFNLKGKKYSIKNNQFIKE